MRQAALFSHFDLSPAVASPEQQAATESFWTPPLCADACVEVLTRPDLPTWIGRGTRVVEPHAGGGAFVRALLRRTPHVRALDVDRTAPALALVPSEVVDFLDWEGEADFVVGNPPFSEAETHVRHALRCAPNVAFLLRLGFLASQERSAFWLEHKPAAVYVLTERPSFTGGGSDSADYCFVVWCRGAKRTEMRWLSWHGHRVGPPPTW